MAPQCLQHSAPGQPKVVIDMKQASNNRIVGREEHGLVQTAYHEAGHAVFMVALTDAPSLVTIIPNTRAVGRVINNGTVAPVLHIQELLAGNVAVDIWNGECGNALLLFDCPDFAETDDLPRVRRCLESMEVTPEALDQKLECYYEATWDSLCAVWSSVKVVAKTLIDRREMGREVLWDILQGHNLFQKMFEVQRKHGLAVTRN